MNSFLNCSGKTEGLMILVMVGTKSEHCLTREAEIGSR
jgi:hypothetical protein